jgi:acyl carrier protein phosphodiesterase
MNFLAHIYLSGNNPKVMTGNFIGDFVKGRHLYDQFEKDIAHGIEIHRAIDLFTDTNPVVGLSKQRLRPVYRHYSSVIVDIFYDHFLAANWQDYHERPLAAFAAECYATIASFDAILPTGVKQMLPHMMRGNWLVNYAQIEGIHGALTGMSHRTKYDSKMDQAVNDLREHYDAFAYEFRQFFPLLKAHIDPMLDTPEAARPKV